MLNQSLRPSRIITTKTYSDDDDDDGGDDDDNKARSRIIGVSH